VGAPSHGVGLRSHGTSHAQAQAQVESRSQSGRSRCSVTHTAGQTTNVVAVPSRGGAGRRAAVAVVIGNCAAEKGLSIPAAPSGMPLTERANPCSLLTPIWALRDQTAWDMTCSALIPWVFRYPSAVSHVAHSEVYLHRVADGYLRLVS
jgi:hypothetical protein